MQLVVMGQDYITTQWGVILNVLSYDAEPHRIPTACIVRKQKVLPFKCASKRKKSLRKANRPIRRGILSPAPVELLEGVLLTPPYVLYSTERPRVVLVVLA